VLSAPDLTGAGEEMARIGVMRPAREWLASKTQVRVVRLEAVQGKAAALLKQECLAVGCDCAVSPEVARFDDTPRAVAIIASLRQYGRLLERLPRQAFGLGEVAEEVRETLAAYEDARRPAWVCRGKRVPTESRTVVMGIINVTPNSFSGDGVGGDTDAAIRQALAFVEAGADILDVGGESTRPGSDDVSAEEEWARIGPVVEALVAQAEAIVSVDTRKPEVAERGLAAGAHIVNDVGALRAPRMAEVVAGAGAGAVIMHMQGEPKTMQQEPRYEDLMGEVYDFLCERMEAALEAGIAENAMAVDPGFGFGKTPEHNLTMVRRLRELHSLGRPVVLGASRKATIGAVLGKPADERLLGTAATCAVGIVCGAHVVRVHDVAEMAQVARMADAVLEGRLMDDAGR
jgi:dihydropteroate synthase